MEEREADSADATGNNRQDVHPSAFEAACPCLNVRVRVTRLQDDEDGDNDGVVQVALDAEAQRDGGAVRVSQPRLVVEDVAASRTSKNSEKGKERASASEDIAATPTTSLRCLSCSFAVLSYPADSDSSAIAPNSKTGHYALDLSPSSKLVVGADRIADLSNKDKNPDWSDLFRLVMPPSPSSSDDAASMTAGKSDAGSSSIDDAEDTTYTGVASSSMARRSSSSDSAIRESTAEGASSPALRRTSSLKRTGSGSRAASAGMSPFHSTARARIKRKRQLLEDKIASLRKEFEADSKRYIEQADTLANRLKAAGRANKRTSSPSTSKGRRTGEKDDADASEEASGVIVIRGGFDPPKAESVSPSQSQNTGFGSYRTPITSPHLATAGNFPALFSSMSGATTTGSPSTTAAATSPDAAKKSGIVQATQPQSPTFRRSRSPSPSRDTSKGRNDSKDRAAGNTDTGGSSAMERRKSDEQQNANAVTAKRPALNLVRDVSNLEQDLEQKKADKANQDERGRSSAIPSTTLPTHSALRNKTQPSNVSSSYTPRGSVPRPRGTWLRLNGLSPSPPVDRLMLDRPVPELDTDKEKAENPEAEAQEDTSKRASLSKHRHVSFKEPEPGSSVEASPAPVEATLTAEQNAEEEDEVPFDMDEDIQHLQDEGELDNDDDDAGFVNVETPEDIDEKGNSAKPESVTRDTVPLGSVPSTEVSISLSSDKKTKAGDSLSALLNDPSSFIGSLKSRNYGASSLPGRSVYDQNSGRKSSSPKDKVSLSDQAQRLRDLLALDAPSHRGSKSKRDRALASYLGDRTGGSEFDEIKDDELDSLAPVSTLATSLPVAIGFTGVNKQKEYTFERKTSVPQRESMLVPRLYDGGKHRGNKMGQYSPHGRLPALGEEPESAPASRAHSPSGVPGPVNTGIGDGLAAGNDETDEVADQLRELRGKDDSAFVPPHVWKFRDRPVSAVDMLGTSIHDYE